MLIVPVASQLPDWTVPGPRNVIFYDPEKVGGMIEAGDWGEPIIVSGGPLPTWIPGEPQPTEEHFEEALRLNPALAGWGEPL